jgi:hypothetical protein
MTILTKMGYLKYKKCKICGAREQKEARKISKTDCRSFNDAHNKGKSSKDVGNKAKRSKLSKKRPRATSRLHLMMNVLLAYFFFNKKTVRGDISQQGDSSNVVARFERVFR